MKTFSVAICTRNRAALLERTAIAVLEQNYPKDRYELLVVDNGSTDDTAHVAAGLAAGAPVPVRLISEPQLGVSRARNRAAQEAQFEFLAYLDDDTIPARSWLKAFDAAIEEHGALVVGGRVEDVYEGFEPPSWLVCRYLRANFRLEHYGSPPVFQVRYPSYIGEGNCAYSRALFERFQFPVTLGHIGKTRGAGGGALLDLVLERQGVPIYFTDHAVVDHMIDSDRVTRRHVMAASYLHGLETARLELVVQGGLRHTLAYTRGLLRQLSSPKPFCTVCKLIRIVTFAIESCRLLIMRRLGLFDPARFVDAVTPRQEP